LARENRSGPRVPRFPSLTTGKQQYGTARKVHDSGGVRREPAGEQFVAGREPWLTPV
jgi:hypothetical protein